jgi:hypothetical protein
MAWTGGRSQLSSALFPINNGEQGMDEKVTRFSFWRSHKHQRPAAYLICHMHNGDYFDLQVLDEPVTIGRSAEANLQIADTLISRVHCVIRADDDKFVIHDLNSRNGTWVNGAKIKQVTLQLGDIIKVGDTWLTFESHRAVENNTSYHETRPLPAPPQP